MVMRITPRLTAKILKGLREKKITREELAEACNKGQSWASKLLHQRLKTLDEDDAIAIENLLDIKLLSSVVRVGDTTLSDSAQEFAKLIDTNPAIQKLADSFLEFIDEQEFTPAYVPTDRMRELGGEIIAITHKNQGKPGKVARLVLELLA